MGLKEECESQGPDFYNKPKKFKNILSSPTIDTVEKENAEHTSSQDPVV